MVMEIEKIASTLMSQGYESGAKELIKTSRGLHDANLIPSSLANVERPPKGSFIKPGILGLELFRQINILVLTSLPGQTRLEDLYYWQNSFQNPPL